MCALVVLHLRNEAMEMSDISIPNRSFIKRGTTLLLALLLLSTLALPLLPLSGGSDTSDDPTRAVGNTPMGDWSQLPTGGWPSSISTSTCEIMYREAQRELVVFDDNSGGYTVWSYFEDNSTWVRWTTTGTGPSNGFDYRAFNSNSDMDVAFFFGGQSGWSVHDKMNIFFYSNKTWIEFNPPASMGGRYGSDITYDQATDSFWIFGGRDGSWTRYSDIHQFNFTSGWNYPTPPATDPQGRDQGMTTITPDGTHIYMTLGRYQSGGGGSRYCTDVWDYNISANTWNELNDDIGVPTETGGILQYRADTNDLLLTMGSDGNTRLDNTYIINITTGNVNRVYLTGGIPARRISGWDLLSDGKTLVIFGNSDDSRDIWSIDTTTLVSDLMPGNPAWGGGTGFTGYDPEDGGKLMTLKYVGGNYWQLVYYSLESLTWEHMDVSTNNTPTYHDGMANAYDAVDNAFYLYGGVYWYEVSNDWYAYHYDEFWKLDCDTGEWTQINEDGPPGERGRAVMVVDEVERNIYLHGGQIAGGASDSLFKYNMTGNVWTSIQPTIKPQGRREHSVEFDPVNNGFYMFGGKLNGSSTADLGDFWFFHTDTEVWEKLPTGEDEPTIQNWAGLSLNTDTNELMLFGDGNDEMFFWRLEWLGWKIVDTPNTPGDWSGHGQAYSPQTKAHYAWARDGTEVWEFNPILRTPAIQIRLYDPDGNTSGSSAVEVFPTIGRYELRVNGITDMPQSDLVGIFVSLKNGNEYFNVTWDDTDYTMDIDGHWDWLVIEPSWTQLTFKDEKTWEFILPMDFTFNMTHGDKIGATAMPITLAGYAEPAVRTNLMRLNSDLEVVGYDLWTTHQDNPQVGGWLFGGTNLNIRDLDVSFRGWPDIYPATGEFNITFKDEFGNSDDWVYENGEKGELSIPIVGGDGQWINIYLNLTNAQQGVMQTLKFTFRVDANPPGVVQFATLRADSFEDEQFNSDNDPNMFFTWGDIVETGSGLKGVCYSLDANLWPSDANLTTEFEQIYVGTEGAHTMYVWAVDKTNRFGPYVELSITIDTHQVYFTDPNPVEKVNITYGSFVVSITINDEISGVDLNTIFYRASMPNKQLSDWTKYDVEGENASSIRVTLDLDLVPDMKNLVQFKARDMAFNDERSSDIFEIFYGPTLGTPASELTGPSNGFDVEKTVKLQWDGAYINPNNLTYELHIILPGGNEETFDVSGMEFSYDPKIPGNYEWFIVSKADGRSSISASGTFSFQPEFVGVDLPVVTEATIGYDVPLAISIENTLEVDVDITITLEVPRGFFIERGDLYELTAGEIRDGFLVLNSSGVEKGLRQVVINASDSYGRFKLITIQLNVKEEKIDGPVVEDEGNDIPIGLIIGVIVGIIILLVIIILVVMKRRKPEEVEEEEEEDDLGKPIDLSYDPTGKVADGGSSVESAVPLAPGMINGNEAEMRSRGSNIIELKLPSQREEEEEIDEELMKPYPPSPEEDELEEDEMEELSEEEMADELYGHSEE